MTDPNTRNRVRRAHERREQSGDTEGLHMEEESEQPGPSDGLAGELAQMIADTKNEQDNIEYYSGGSQRNQSAERLLAKVLEHHEAILAALTTREAAVEACAKVAEQTDWRDETFPRTASRIAAAIRDLAPTKPECPSCHGLNTSCPEGCGRDPKTGELDGSTWKGGPAWIS